MPDNHTPPLVCTWVLISLMVIMTVITAAPASEGIETYYIRYDVKSSRNKIVHDNLLMIPAKNDFRAEKFSQVTAAGVISAAPGDATPAIDRQIREDALKTVLVTHGLKSVKAKDHDTVVSYEGVMMTPLNILKTSYHEDLDRYAYEVQVVFCPIAFPDQWERLHMKHKIKAFVNDFFELFK